MDGPLSGVRVLDMTAALSGPVATQILGDMGAEVIKIEPPEGDSIRDLGPARHRGMGAMFLHTNRSKRSIVLDLKLEGGREAFRRLAGTADVFVCNTRPKAMARLGLAYADIAALNPALVYLNIVGYGSAGTHADKPAYDDLIQAAAGIASLRADGDPARYAPIALADRVTGILAANAVLGALYHRARTGAGQHIEVPMFESIASLVLSDHMAGLSFEPPIGPPVFDRYASIRRPFQTRDGFLCMMVLTDRQWREFFRAVGRPEVMDDDRFGTMAQRTRNLEALYAIVSAIMATRDTDAWVAHLEAADIPVARIESVASLTAHPHLAQAGFFQTVEHPTEGPIRSMACASTWSATQPAATRPAPRLGEHSLEILREAGFSEEETQAMFASGAARGYES
ncbi:CaiB/BaiF CoA transferase family protein [Bordetella bronchiseptica]|uniref:CaiB/BaiF CoA transferase family protein n=2 Tax=Bordetella bronchiseptica TaxID=518 RepID=UPI00028B41F2|nr:CoA transferase [Bordetella bronchiseptica]KDD58362.1 CoA-transferase family III protein [Bordetella bronchiseptica OSU553]AWQ07241.1 CoA transferase [Bordetella bronchiseptica]AZW32668.1 CoA transferase [Bordetella bronchiseptica]KAK75588.1 CoA-transferase family III protein [Bordetella bronchiseptica MO211]KCV42356.1 CoA-transferase family III protein [Bordetella bronchiseptica 345]